MATHRLALAGAITSLLLTACSGGSDSGSDDTTSQATPTEVASDSNDGSTTDENTDSGSELTTELTAEDVSEVQAAASAYYESVAPENIVITDSRIISQTDCELIVTFPGSPEFDKPLNFVRTPDGALVRQDLDSFDQAMQPCFYLSLIHI